MAKRVACSLVAALIAILSVEATAYEHAGAVTRSAIAPPILEKTVKLQIPFIENLGQVQDADIRFYAHAFGGTVSVSRRGELLYALPLVEENSTAGPDAEPFARLRGKGGWILKESVVGAPPREPRGLEPTRTKVSCYLGNDPGSWRKEIPTYAQVSLGEVTNDIDLVVRAYGRTVEKVFTVHPGGKVATLVLKIEGAQGLEVNEQGELEVATGLGKARFSRPVAYQEKEGKREFVSAAYRVLDKQTYGFEVSAYDNSRPLVIDPLLASTYLGGVGNDWGYALALDGAGNVYVAGCTMSAGFPTTPGAYDTSYGSPEDAFVTKLDPNLTEVLASSYIGGSGSYSFYGADGGKALSIDSEGNVYVAGATASANFPTTVGAYDRSWNGDFDTFVCVLDADLTTLLASTFLGGGQSEFDPQLAVNGDGDVFVSGWTYSANFPTSEGAYDISFGGNTEGYVARLNGTLTSLSASTFLGGVGGERIGAMTLDASGNVYVAGMTWRSPDFPVTQGAYNTTYEDGIAFVSKLDVTLTTLLASSFLGIGFPQAMAIADAGDIYLAGTIIDYGGSEPPNYPTTPGAYDTSVNGGQEAFLSRMDPGLTTLLASTFLGGSEDDEAFSIVLGNTGNVYVTGMTYSADFPATPGVFDTSLSGSCDVFVSMLDANLSTLLGSSFLGGIADDYGRALAIDALGNVYLAGYTHSIDFPMTVDTYDARLDGGWDAFVAKMNGFSPDRLRERFSSQTDATETLGRQTVTLEGGALSGALTGTISLFDLEMVSIQTGPFAGKGFYKGTWQANAEGVQFSGTWQGMFFPDNAEGTIELRGTASGEISGLVEGSLRESTRGSGLFDQLRAILRLHNVAGQEVSGIVHLTGRALYGTTEEYPSTGLRLLQTSLEAEGAASFTDRLGVTLTQVLVADESNPYDGQGFSFLSYIADPGPGLGWTWDNQAFPGRVEMKGLFTGSLLGIAAITMDETGPERTLLVRFERVGLSRATGPMPDLEVATWGPDRISPGLIIDFVDYIIFYCNRGATKAEGVFLVDRLPVEVGYVKSSEGSVYRPESHEVIWELGTLAPGEAGLLSVKCVMTRGLIENVNFNNQVMIGCTNPELDTVLFPEMTALTPWWNDAMIFYDGPLIPWTPISSDTEGDVRDFPYIDVNVRDAIRLVDEVSGNEALELARLHMQGRINVDGNLDSQGLWNAQFVLNELGYSEMYLSGGSTYDVLGVGVGEFLDQNQGRYPGLEGFSFRHIPESAPPSLGTPEENLLRLAGILVHENTHRKQTMGEFYSGGEKGEIQAHQAQADFFFSYALKKAEEGDYDSAFTSLDLADETWGMLRERSTNASWPKGQEAAEIGKQYTAMLRQLIEERRLFEATEEGKRFKETMERLQEELPYDFSIRNNGYHMLSVLLAHDPNAKYGPEGSISAGQTLSYRVEFENEGEGIAYGVYFTDILDTDLDDSTLSIGPVLDVETGAEIAPPGIYDPRTRTITWFVGTVEPHRGGYADFSVNVRADAPDGTEVINYATVYFPSVPEETRTNGIVSIVGEEFPPVAVAGGPYEGAVGIPILFDASGSYDEGTTAGISVYEWDWDGDGIFDETTSSPTVEHLWDTPYSGIVNLRIIDKGGLTDTDSASVEVVPRIPIARAGGPYDGTVGLPIVLDASGSEDPDGTIVSYEWDWDGDRIFDEATPHPVIEHTWVEEYAGLVRLKVVDNDGLAGFGAAYVEVQGCNPTGVPESACNGADDDCDGAVDEDFVPETTSCGQGVCAATGQSTCVNGQIIDSCAPGEPQAEGPYGNPTCSDGLDNDCDGAADSDDSDCEHACTPTGIPESLCNGADDDCDGQADEDFVSSPTSCGVGVCAATGQSTCVSGQIGDTCQPGNPTGADDNCNGLDENCDGTADENFIPAPTSCGMGVCAATGQSTCVNGQITDSCTPGQPTGADNDCNGVDENCNGTADENFVSTQTSCGVGECSSTGVLACEDGLLVDSCLPGIPSEEVCDARDNNCNGEIDEGVLTAFYLDLDGDGYGDPDPAFRVEACEAPPAYVENPTDCNDNDSFIHPGAEEVCNGVDDNCDGSLDEGFDQDSDGHTVCAGDCNDQDPAIHPGAAEVCADGQDNDCDGFVDAHDPDCVVGQPDLKGSLSRFPHVKRIKRGQWLVVGKLKIRNLGDADAGGFVVKYYYIPKGGTVSQYLKTTSLLGLTQGQTTVDRFEYWFSFDPVGGTLLAVIDADNTVAESNESNNESRRKIH